MDHTTQQQQPIGSPLRPKNWLVESILVTIFCCLPFGIAGIVFASQVNAKYEAGDYEGAMSASKEAGRWTKIGFFIGLACIVLYFVSVLFWGGWSFWQARHHEAY